MLFIKKNLLACILILPVANGAMAQNDRIQSLIDAHRSEYQDKEHFTAVQVSIKAGKTIKHYTSGTIALGSNQPELTSDHLFNIGSITKSFTAALALQAEARQQLNLHNSLQKYLDQYPQWGHLRLEQLLNMSSGLPNYSNSPTMNMSFVYSLDQVWKPTEMAGLVYKKGFNPPLQTGYHYTNTGYILLDMILQQQTKHSYAALLSRDIIAPLGLNNTFYPVPKASPEVKNRLVSGYGFNVYDNPELVGRDMKNNNLSWAGAAGGLVANSMDVLRWVDALFEGDTVLDAEQKKKMQTLISVETGKPLTQTNSDDPEGFGLGIAQKYRSTVGRFWFYEGQTLGYRALYMYIPCNKVIIVALFNSATNAENDHSGLLMETLYLEVLKQHDELTGCTV